MQPIINTVPLRNRRVSSLIASSALSKKHPCQACNSPQLAYSIALTVLQILRGTAKRLPNLNVLILRKMASTNRRQRMFHLLPFSYLRQVFFRYCNSMIALVRLISMHDTQPDTLHDQRSQPSCQRSCHRATRMSFEFLKCFVLYILIVVINHNFVTRENEAELVRIANRIKHAACGFSSADSEAIGVAAVRIHQVGRLSLIAGSTKHEEAFYVEGVVDCMIKVCLLSWFCRWLDCPRHGNDLSTLLRRIIYRLYLLSD